MVLDGRDAVGFFSDGTTRARWRCWARTPSRPRSGKSSPPSRDGGADQTVEECLRLMTTTACGSAGRAKTSACRAVHGDLVNWIIKAQNRAAISHCRTTSPALPSFAPAGPAFAARLPVDDQLDCSRGGSWRPRWTTFPSKNQAPALRRTSMRIRCRAWRRDRGFRRSR